LVDSYQDFNSHLAHENYLIAKSKLNGFLRYVYLVVDKEHFIQQGWAGEKDQELTEIDVLTPLKRKPKSA
jgi:hypothetical protein